MARGSSQRKWRKIISDSIGVISWHLISGGVAAAAIMAAAA